MYPHLFSPLTVGALTLRNRVVMAPMTRSRATDDDLVTDLHVEYYRQRANAGLIVTEGVHPSADGKGYNRTPGIYNEEQVSALLSMGSFNCCVALGRSGCHLR